MTLNCKFWWSTYLLVSLFLQSTGAFIAVSRYASATPMPPSILSRGVGWQVLLVICTFSSPLQNNNTKFHFVHIIRYMCWFSWDQLKTGQFEVTAFQLLLGLLMIFFLHSSLCYFWSFWNFVIMLFYISGNWYLIVWVIWYWKWLFRLCVRQ